jgi:hypothetical protein
MQIFFPFSAPPLSALRVAKDNYHNHSENFDPSRRGLRAAVKIAQGGAGIYRHRPDMRSFDVPGAE